jgi:hypothetical protein
LSRVLDLDDAAALRLLCSLALLLLDLSALLWLAYAAYGLDFELLFAGRERDLHFVITIDKLAARLLDLLLVLM